MKNVCQIQKLGIQIFTIIIIIFSIMSFVTGSLCYDMYIPSLKMSTFSLPFNHHVILNISSFILIYKLPIIQMKSFSIFCSFFVSSLLPRSILNLLLLSLYHTNVSFEIRLIFFDIKDHNPI